MIDAKLETAYERLCSMILDGKVSSCSFVLPDAALDNLFYERFGMSSLELLWQFEAQMTQKQRCPIDIVGEFH